MLKQETLNEIGNVRDEKRRRGDERGMDVSLMNRIENYGRERERK